MITPGISDPTLSLMEKNLDLRLRKHQLIVSNIANIDTPNYKPFNIVVKDAFEKIENRSNAVKLRTSDPKHLNTNGYDRYKIEVIQEDPVGIDKAMSDLAENTMIYNATAQILSKKFNLLKQSITGGY